MTNTIFDLQAPADFSLLETVSAHGWRRLAPFIWDEAVQTLERAEALPGGVVRLRMSGAADGGVRVEVSGDAAPDDADEIARRAYRMLQLDLPLEGFHAYCRTHPNLAHLAECRRGRMLRSPTLWEDVVKVIATTNTTWAQTIAMSARLVSEFGTGGRTFPAPAQIASVAFDDFAAGAKMGYRNAYVYAIASAVADSSLDLEAWQTEPLTTADLRKRLLSLPGIGPYGAACLLLCLGKPAHVNADSVARASLSQEMGRPVTDKEVHDFFAAHGEWRGLVYNFYPWRDA